MRPPLPIGAHGEISAVKIANGKWRARAYYRDTTGKRRDITANATSKAAAVNKLREKIAAYQPVEETTATMRLKDFTQIWLKDYKKTVTFNTFRQTSLIIKNFIEPVGQIRLNEITVPWLEKQIAAAGEKRTRDGRTIGGPSSATRLRIMYKMILGEAVRLGALPVNPAEQTRAVKIEREAVKALSPEQMTELRKTVRDFYLSYPHWTRAKEWMPDFIDFLVGTGCRVGEAVSLKWDDLDLESGLCTIRSTAIIDSGASVYQPYTKTKNDRAITLPGWLIAVLRERERRSGGEGFVFTAKGGGMVKYSVLTHNFKNSLGGKFGKITPKIIRASVATMIERELGLEAAGLQLGHDDFKTTKKSYIERRGVSDAVGVLGGL
ncbi:tyrosine-type recombinase/integrase [Rothia sp. CCM 9417]|uniref:tyrosine-type recombinase/integrase n=1 Tax=Rothia sp. CCM 9417 TaxID=3402657 RepID=UPI003AE3AC74